MDTPKKVLSGKFGKWTILKYGGKYRSSTAVQDQRKCKCECGVVKLVAANNLVRGHEGV